MNARYLTATGMASAAMGNVNAYRATKATFVKKVGRIRLGMMKCM